MTEFSFLGELSLSAKCYLLSMYLICGTETITMLHTHAVSGPPRFNNRNFFDWEGWAVGWALSADSRPNR